MKCYLNISAVGRKVGSTKLASATRGVLALAVFSLLLVTAAKPARGQAETVLYRFMAVPDGENPLGAVVLDNKGNLYGTTVYGGYGGAGTVFELTSAGTEKVLYSFGSQFGDGTYPVAGLVFDKKGNLYGTTQNGGANDAGTVFELTSAGTEKVLYSFFCCLSDGALPSAGLVFDKEGNLYGTTYLGGTNDAGTVFELTSAGTEKVLYSFGGYRSDGSNPDAGLVFDKKGNLYSTTRFGGANGAGTVFELTSSGTEKVLYSFGSQSGDGSEPYAGLVFDQEGNLYGTTLGRGVNDFGTVFELTSAGTEKVLYSFGSQSGGEPYAGLVFDKKGNLYGEATSGGANLGGTVFELTSAGTEKVLYSFSPHGGGGTSPSGGLVFDKKGNLYGTTVYGGYGGANGWGTLFKVTP
jgi:uncharacterized repeat protein (TIGR03803 family)